MLLLLLLWLRLLRFKRLDDTNNPQTQISFHASPFPHVTWFYLFLNFRQKSVWDTMGGALHLPFSTSLALNRVHKQIISFAILSFRISILRHILANRVQNDVSFKFCDSNMWLFIDHGICRDSQIVFCNVWTSLMSNWPSVHFWDLSHLVAGWYQFLEMLKVCLENWEEKFNLKPQPRRKS